MQINGQQDGERVGDNSGHVVDVDVRRHVGAAFSPRKPDGQRRQAHRAGKKSQREAGQEVAHAESHGYADGHEQKCGDDHLRDVEADLCHGGVNVAALQRPPSQRLGFAAFRHTGVLPPAVRCSAANSTASLMQIKNQFQIYDLKIQI